MCVRHALPPSSRCRHFPQFVSNFVTAVAMVVISAGDSASSTLRLVIRISNMDTRAASALCVYRAINHAFTAVAVGGGAAGDPPGAAAPPAACCCSDGGNHQLERFIPQGDQSEDES